MTAGVGDRLSVSREVGVRLQGGWHVRCHHDALFIGDAIATLNVMTGQTGPRIAPFTADRAQALASLSRLEGIEAGLVLPGHGQPWTNGVDAVVGAARAAAT